MKTTLPTRCMAWVLAAAASGSACAGPVLIIRSNNSATDNPTNQAVANLSAWQAEAGNTVTVATTLPASLTGYGQVWDLGFRNPLASADAAAYMSYLQQGGRLAMIGDNTFLFSARDQGIAQLIAEAGGGTVGVSEGTSGLPPQTVRTPFADAAVGTQLNFPAPAYFTGTGHGSWMAAEPDDSLGTGLYFDEGDLAQARAGRLMAVLDVDFLGDLVYLPVAQQLARSMIAQLDGSTGGQVPEPPSPALIGLALVMGWRASRDRSAG